MDKPHGMNGEKEWYTGMENLRMLDGKERRT